MRTRTHLFIAYHQFLINNTMIIELTSVMYFLVHIARGKDRNVKYDYVGQ